MQLTRLKEILDSVAPSYYLTYQPSDVEEEKAPIIIFSKLSSSFKEYSDDRSNIRTTLYQANLISKDVKQADVLSMKLEETLIANELAFSLTSEYQNENNTISTIYEITTEEFENGK